MSCNISSQRKNISKGQDSTKISLNTTNTDIIKVSPSSKTCSLENLLAHFKDNSKFPVIIDSTYLIKVAKHDSLGTSELKLLANKWIKDSLVNDSDYFMQNFYTIDSLKVNHLYDHWMEVGTESGHNLGDPTHSNAYSLEKLKLSDGTILLVWVLEARDDADPLFNDIIIYFTTLYNNTIRETFKLGDYYSGVDPPAAGRTILSSILTADGRLIMEENAFETEDLEDSSKGKSTIIHYEYSISNGNLTLIKKEDKTKQSKFKN